MSSVADLSRQKILKYHFVAVCLVVPPKKLNMPNNATISVLPYIDLSHFQSLKSKVKTISLYMQHRSPIVPARTTPILEVMEPIRIPNNDLSLHNLCY